MDFYSQIYPPNMFLHDGPLKGEISSLDIVPRHSQLKIEQNTLSSKGAPETCCFLTYLGYPRVYLSNKNIYENIRLSFTAAWH